MSLMTENKARRILKEYMDAELKGDEKTAMALEQELNAAGWKISVGAEGYTVIRENGGLFFSDDKEAEQPPLAYRPVTTANTGGVDTRLIIGISLTALAFLLIIILGVRAYKMRKGGFPG